MKNFRVLGTKTPENAKIFIPGGKFLGIHGKFCQKNSVKIVRRAQLFFSSRPDRKLKTKGRKLLIFLNWKLITKLLISDG